MNLANHTQTKPINRLFFKTKIMKKIFALAFIAVAFAACNDADTDTTSVDTDTTTTSTTMTTTRSYTAAEGDVSYRNEKLMVYRNGDWVESDKDVTLDNGIVVSRKGEVRRDKDVVVINDGEVIDRSGNFWDKTGNAIEDGWDATKRGVKNAGNAIEKGAKKVGEETKDVFTDDKKKKDTSRN